MNWIVDNVALISLIFAGINIVITLINWYLRHPRLVFYDDGRENVFYTSGSMERCYEGSKCVAFFYLKIANQSDMPCTISEFSLSVEGYQDTFYRSNTQLLDKYTIYQSDSNCFGINEVYITRDMIIDLPCTIPPLGYVEGNAVFPYAPDYNKTKLYAEVTAKTARKCFKTDGFISPYNDDRFDDYSSVPQ